MTDLLIPRDLLEAVGGYLVQRPYAEVATLIDALRRLRPVEPPAPESPPE